jgi:FkbM family methyltransferase
MDQATRELRSEDISPLMRIAFTLNRVLPRGKGAVPRAIGKWMPSGEHRHFIRTRQGAMLAVEPTSLDVYASIVNLGRTWNWHVMAACAAVLRPGDTLFDIGANIGFMSMELSRVFAGADPARPLRVVAFEPLPQLVEAIRASARSNGFDRITVRAEIVGNSPGTAELFLGSHSIHASTRARENRSQVLRLPAVTIDALVESGAISAPNVIKIDVEGGELAAFQGAANTLRRHAPHIVFESDVNTVRFNYTRKDLLDFLRSVAPYRFFSVPERGTVTLVPLPEEFDAASHPADVLATTLPDDEIAKAISALARWSANRFVTLE